MKTINVTLSDEQFDYLESITKAFGNVPPGDMLLGQAFAGLSMAEGMEGCFETLVCALNQFVGQRALPTLTADNLLEYGITSRPAGSHIKEMKRRRRASS